MPIINTNYNSSVPSLTNPATVDDVLRGKEFINENGDKQTGIYINADTGVLDGSLSGVYTNIEITKLRNYAFATCSNLIEINLPNVKSVGTGCFYTCTNLQKVYLPNVTTMGQSFNASPSVTDLYVNIRVTSTQIFSSVLDHPINVYTEGDIDQWVSTVVRSLSTPYYLYLNGEKQTDIILNNVTIIQPAVLSRCLFNSITFSSNLTSISRSAFYSTVNCILFDFRNSTVIPALLQINGFGGINQNAKIVVPDALYEDWIMSANWSDASIVSHIVKASDYTG